MKLYDSTTPGTRGTRVRWMLEELGVPYEREAMEFAKGHMRAPEHLARQPHGKVPAFELDGTMLIESGAICMQLADLHPEATMAPEVGTPERALWYQWIAYGISTLDDALVSRIFNAMILPEDKRNPSVVQKADSVWAAAAPYLSKALEGRDWLLGDTFTAADVVVGYDVDLAARQGLLEGYPVLAGYHKRLTARPAFKTAYGG